MMNHQMMLKAANEVLSAAEMRKKIVALEQDMLAHPDILVDFPLEHFFAPGLYMRQMTVPKNGYLTGRIHKTEHYCILAKGTVRLVTEDGTRDVSAPAVLHSMPGAKRAIFALEEMIWINVHHNPTDEHDLDKLWELFTVATYEEFAAQSENK